jgi:hypothetical protein
VLGVVFGALALIALALFVLYWLFHGPRREASALGVETEADWGWDDTEIVAFDEGENGEGIRESADAVEDDEGPESFMGFDGEDECSLFAA